MREGGGAVKSKTEQRIPQDARGAIEAYLRTFDDDQPVPMSALMRAARRALRDIALSDEELADLIAREAIQANRTILFDDRKRDENEE